MKYYFHLVPWQCYTIETLVRSQDLYPLMEQLHQCASKWEEIGLALNFQHGELKNIIYFNPRANAQQLLIELLSQWTQWPTADHPQDPTMERLCYALRSGLVGLGAIANVLYEKRQNLSTD